tara:strand:- start:1241 stop:1519 length:279 start_codon:yes stop_codon:yes gene_type:complete
MRKSVRDQLNNIRWVKTQPRVGSTRPRYLAQLTEEWNKREFFLEKDGKMWFVFDNITGERLAHSLHLEVLNIRLNKENEGNKLFNKWDGCNK